MFHNFLDKTIEKHQNMYKVLFMVTINITIRQKYAKNLMIERHSLRFDNASECSSQFSIELANCLTILFPNITIAIPFPPNNDYDNTKMSISL